MASYKYYEIEKCPLANECSQANFPNYKFWGFTHAEVKERVVQHLLGSGLHKERGREREYYEKLVQGCKVVEKDWPEEPARKAPRHAPPSSYKTEAPMGAGIPMTPSNAFDPAPARPSSAASASAIALLRASPKACSVSSMEYKSIIDACGRACKAAKHVQRQAAQAHTWFAEGGEEFQDVQQHMTEKLREY